MTVEEINRLSQGTKILAKIEKLEAQIKALNGVTHFQLKTAKEVPNRGVRGLYDTDMVVNMGIPLNINDKVPHPFAQSVLTFVTVDLVSVLQQQLIDLKISFQEL